VTAKTTSAVSFAAKMIREGTYVGKAISVASGYYGVPYAEVQRGLASRSGASQAGKKRRPALSPPNVCQECGARPPVWRGRARLGYHSAGTYFTCDACGPRIPSWVEGAEDANRWVRLEVIP
jgi:hypothetical protein